MSQKHPENQVCWERWTFDDLSACRSFCLLFGCPRHLKQNYVLTRGWAVLALLGFPVLHVIIAFHILSYLSCTGWICLWTCNTSLQIPRWILCRQQYFHVCVGIFEAPKVESDATGKPEAGWPSAELFTKRQSCRFEIEGSLHDDNGKCMKV